MLDALELGLSRQNAECLVAIRAWELEHRHPLRTPPHSPFVIRVCPGWRTARVDANVVTPQSAHVALHGVS
jgi:hypothetical protein